MRVILGISTCATVWVLSWIRCFCHGTPFLLHWTADRQTMVLQTWSLGIHFLKWMKWACCFQEKNWKYILPLIKYKLSSRNENFGKLVSTTMNLTDVPYLKIFLMRSMVILTNIISWYCKIKCVHVWKICITQNQHFLNNHCMML